MKNPTFAQLKESFHLRRCDKSVTDGGDLASGNSLWQTTGRLVTRLTIPDTEALCSRIKGRINAFLPLSRLTRSSETDIDIPHF